MNYRLTVKFTPDVTTHGMAETLREAADQIEHMNSVQAAHSMKIESKIATGEHGICPPDSGGMA